MAGTGERSWALRRRSRTVLFRGRCEGDGARANNTVVRHMVYIGYLDLV